MTDQYVCPCGSDAYQCDRTHGATGGPALHCRRSPAHNAWVEDDWTPWMSWLSAPTEPTTRAVAQGSRTPSQSADSAPNAPSGNT